MKEYPPLLTKSQALELTGLQPHYLDRIRKMSLVKVYQLQGTASRGECRYYKQDLLKHLKLDEQGNYKEYDE